MPRQTHPNTLAKIVANDTNVPQHARIAAVRWLGPRASLKLLKSLIQRKDTPGRMKALCLEMYQAKILALYNARQLRKTNQTKPEETE